MSELRFTSNSPEFQAMLKSLGSKLYKIAKEEFVDLQETWVQRMRKQQFSGYYPGPTRGRKLRARTGHLRSSVGGRVTGNKLGSLKALLRVGGGRAGYARIQEEGGTIRAGSKMLTIPLPDALRPDTGTLYPKAVIRKEGGGYTTGFGDTFVLNLNGRPVIMARRDKGNGVSTVVPLYTLKRSVKIEPRLGAEEKLHHLAMDRLPKISDRLLRVLVETKGAV
jgi:hypothetical protein